jgi:DNA-binding response OmpR family regulator
MPGKNGLELLKLVKKEWPLTKAVMMTAYASTETAMKAIRLGALEYLPKPFTPQELRKVVEEALSGKLIEAEISEEEREAINVIDIDMPFDTDEVAKQTGDDYVNMLGRSDMPVVEVKMPEPLENYCEAGNMVCDIFKKLGATCKAGTKSGECPQLKTKKAKKKKKDVGFDGKQFIGIDQPFSYDEVTSITGPEYVQHLHHDGVAFVPFEELKAKMQKLTEPKRDTIDVDMPFDRDEVAKQTGEQYVDTLGRSDIPAVEITASEPLENFCETGAMVCDIFKKLGATCKAGTKTGECPQKKAKKGKTAKKTGAPDMRKVIGIDQPFDVQEVTAITGSQYVQNLHREGTVITPYEELKARVAELTTKTVEAERVQTGLPTVLVIDDEVTVNNNIRKILQKKGYQVEQAVTKQEALTKIQARTYQLVLLDLRLPGVRGLELLKALRDKNPQAKVIIITGYASIDTAVEAARLGAIDYLAKPFTPDEIRDATDKALQLAA